MSTQDYLLELETVRVTLANIEAHMKQAIDAAIPPEVAEAIAQVKAEYAEYLAPLQATEKDLTEKVKQWVIIDGHSVKGTWLTARYNRGRTTWDNQGLAGYAVAYPEILAFKSEGNPYVSFVEDKRGPGKD